MYLIALCDDEASELDKTERMLSDYEKKYEKTKFEIDRFESPVQLLEMVREKGYAPDLILMDIYMPEKPGIEAARELREMGCRGKLIFLTTSRDHALDAFTVDAAQYLVKPVAEKQLFPVLHRMLEDMEEERRKYLVLRIEGRTQRVALHNLVYCEANGKTQHIHMSDSARYVLRITMTELYEMISRYQEFVRIGVAYIVNLEHVESFNAQELQMDNGKKIYLPRGSFQSLRERYFDFYCGNDDGGGYKS